VDNLLDFAHKLTIFKLSYPKIVNFTAKLTGLLTGLRTIYTSIKRHFYWCTKTLL